ncbi:hypothetical protein [Streptomyces formicae]|nr:hypothetical protein [Streptomyces formicae]
MVLTTSIGCGWLRTVSGVARVRSSVAYEVRAWRVERLERAGLAG